MSEIPPQEGETGKEGGGSADGGDLTVNVGSVNRSTTEDFNPEKEKALGARDTARVLVYTFAGAVAALFLTIALIFGLSASPSQAGAFVKAFVDIVPVMENFVTKIFGPLLAFVLGYYFGEKKTS